MWAREQTYRIPFKRKRTGNIYLFHIIWNLMIRVGADPLSPPWFRLRAAPPWAYRFLSDRRIVTPRRGDRGPRVCGRRGGGLGSRWPHHGALRHGWRCFWGGVVIKMMKFVAVISQLTGSWVGYDPPSLISCDQISKIHDTRSPGSARTPGPPPGFAFGRRPLGRTGSCRTGPPPWRIVTPRRGDRGPRVCGRRGGLGSMA